MTTGFPKGVASLWAAVVDRGDLPDCPAADDLMARPAPKPGVPLADKGFDGDRFQESLLMRGILPIIPPCTNRTVPQHPDDRRMKNRMPRDRFCHRATL